MDIYQKNDEIRLLIEDISDKGDGIGRLEGMVFFVKHALPGDFVLAGITKVKKTYCYARIIEIIEPSKDRISAVCPVAKTCGGCSMMHLAYNAQLQFKQKRVSEALIRIGGFDKELVGRILKPIVGMEEPYFYRNKAQYPLGYNKDGNIIAGFYAAGSHRIIESDKCYIGQEIDSKILDIVKNWMRDFDVSVYDEKSHKGLIRHVIIRHAISNNQTMVTLVSTKKNIKNIDELCGRLETIDSVKSICLNINPNRGNIILGNKTIVLDGSAYIEDEYCVDYNKSKCKIKVRISSNSFYQVNHEQMEKLYSKALEYAKLTGEENVWDLYCGIGTITIPLALHAKAVMGIETVGAAIEDANENAKLNWLSNISFYLGDAEDVLNDIETVGSMSNPDVVVLDPPRAGCDIKALNAIVSAAPKRIVYVSCNPATLARDLRVLVDGGYELREVTPYDQFCHGGHVESVVLISKKNS